MWGMLLLCLGGSMTCYPVTRTRPIPVLVRCRIGPPPKPVAEIVTTEDSSCPVCYTLLHGKRLAQYLARLQRYAQDAYDLCADHERDADTTDAGADSAGRDPS